MPPNHSRFLRIFNEPEHEYNGFSALNSTLTIRCPSVRIDGVLVRLYLKLSIDLMQRYDGDALQASNESGPLTLCIENIGQEREWIVARASDGDVTLRYHAVPEVTDQKIPIRT